ncbi:hypothetical protein [Solimonas soli]|uniref:hypothetical protein n=1 Tax=Solimonas soli TaxID=413479 RepID=UPI00048032B9|nr:hypothetical protein [Solimonas soli]
MSGPENRRPPDDHELDEFLAGGGPHRARYRAASTEQAPAALDAAVLAQARAAVTPPALRRRAARRWRLPLSIAATLLLSVGLVSRVQREAPPPAIVAQAKSAPGEAAGLRASAPDTLAAAPAPPARAEAPRSEKRIVVAPQAARPREALPPPPPPPPPATAEAEAEAEAQGAALAQARAGQSERRRAEAAQARAAAPMPPAAQVPAPPSGFAAGHYRSAQDFELQLSDDGRFRLAAPPGASPPPVLTGRRRREGDAEWLLPDDAADASCRYSLRREGDALDLQSSCGSAWAGRYWPR